MASGSISLTSAKAWRGKISWSSTPNTAGNYSDLYVYASMWKTDGYLTSSNSRTSGTITIDGTDYDLTGYQEFEDAVCIFEDTVRIYHSSDGTRSVSISLSCSGQYGTSLSGYTLDGSGTAILDTIVRSATLSVDDGTLGTEQTIAINSDSSSLTYTVKYSCGTKSGTICTKSSSKSIKWTPPLTLAEENTTGGTVSVKLSLTTYSGSTSVGTDSETIQCDIPESVKPSFDAEFTDAAGFLEDYGTFIQSLSKLHTVVTSTGSYGSTIKGYKITANGETFTTAESTTGVLTSSGDITVQIVVTDSRDRTAESDFTVNVTAHTLPVVSSLSVHRCDSTGKENDQGAYVQVTFSASADPFDSKNTVAYKLEYKKSSAASYTVVNLTAYKNNFAISGKTYIFSADTGSSYDVRLTVTDSFSVVSKSTTASTAATIMHFKANGKGLGLGKVAEVDNAIDVGWLFQMNGHTVTGLPTPTSDSDAVPKSFVSEQIQNVKDEVISLSDVYPIGAIYISTVATSPASLFGGSWTQLTDRFLIGAGSSYAVDETGGAATVTLSTSQIPSHNHEFQYSTNGGSSWYGATMGRDGSYSDTPYLGTKSSVAEFASYQVRVGKTGGGGSHNNMPPYLAVYMWKRIA